MAAVRRKGFEYAGETKNQLREGYGVYNYENNFFQYEGEWLDGKKHGHGKLSMQDGSYYIGQFYKGEIHGRGEKFSASLNCKYSGEFKNGEMSGRGIMTYGTGDIYEGEWQKNQRDGLGKYFSNDGSEYDGEYYAHKRHGEGAHIYGNGDRYVGDWVDDKKHGFGEMRYSDGSSYKGQWNADQYSGQGLFMHCSGVVYEGLWVGGKPGREAVRLKLRGVPEDELTLHQGAAFVVTAECQSQEGRLVENDQGRQISFYLGFRNYPVKSDLSESPEGEETPIETPFGYSVVAYPLSDDPPPEAVAAMEEALAQAQAQAQESRQATVVSEDEDDDEAAPDAKPQDEPAPETREVTAASLKLEEELTQITLSDVSPAPAQSKETTGLSTREDTGIPSVTVDRVPVPGVPTLRAKHGQASWGPLYLPGPPAGYKPYVGMDEAKAEAKQPKHGKGKKGERRQSSSSPARGPAVDEKSGKTPAPITDLKKEKTKDDDKFPRVGEYVIIVRDVTDPPFLGHTLEPAFVKLNIQKKPKMKRESKARKKHSIIGNLRTTGRKSSTGDGTRQAT